MLLWKALNGVVDEEPVAVSAGRLVGRGRHWKSPVVPLLDQKSLILFPMHSIRSLRRPEMFYAVPQGAFETVKLLCPCSDSQTSTATMIPVGRTSHLGLRSIPPCRYCSSYVIQHNHLCHCDRQSLLVPWNQAKTRSTPISKCPPVTDR